MIYKSEFESFKGKYIITMSDDVYIIPISMKHSDFVLAHQIDKKNIKSGGFISILSKNSGILVQCSGEAVSLGIGSNPSDANMIRACYQF